MPPTTSKPKAKKATPETPLVEVGTDNVFADLGISQPDMALVKAKLIQQIRDSIAERKLTQTQAAKLLGLDQPKVSALLRGRTDGYTTDRLFKFLNRLGQHVEITTCAAATSTQAEIRVISRS